VTKSFPLTGVSASGSVGDVVKIYWTTIVDSQDANWQNIDDSETAGWALIDTSETNDWVLIDTAS
jgi:hypothetical protein